MTDNWMQFDIDMDDRAEGSPDLPEEIPGAAALPASMTVSALSGQIKERKPAAETGLLDIVKISAEGLDDGDIQDASRTGDETQQTGVVEKETAQDMDKPLTVLLVEDTIELAEVIQATLESMDLHVVHAAHGDRALQKFHELNPEVVLLDISLPDMTGWNIMDAIKERLERSPGDMPIIIVITAYDDPANRLVGKLQGVYSYLIKPFTADQIEQTVSQAINSLTS